MADTPVKAGTVTSLASKFGGMKRIVGGIRTKSKRDSRESHGHENIIEEDGLDSEHYARSSKEDNSIGGRRDVEGGSTVESKMGTERSDQRHDSLREQSSDAPITTQRPSLTSSPKLFAQKPQTNIEVVENVQLPSLEQKPNPKNPTRLWDITAELRRQSSEEPEITQPETSEDWAKEYQSLLDYSWLYGDQVSQPGISHPRHGAGSKPRLLTLSKAATGVIGKAGNLGAKSSGEGGNATWDDLKHIEDSEDQAGQQIRGEQLKLVNKGLVRICQKDWEADDNGLTRITGRHNEHDEARQKLARVRDGRGYIDYSHNR